MDIKRALNVISLLESVASKQMDPAKAIKEWPDIDSEKDKLIASAWHDLSHYENDIDIRTKDSEFDSKMREGLRNKASKIRFKYHI